MDPNVFETANAGFAQVMYEEFLRDPASVAPEWKQLFESGIVGEMPAGATNGGRGAESTESTETTESTESAESTLRSQVPSAPSAPSVPSTTTAAAPSSEPLKGPAARLVQNMTESLGVPTATSFRELAVARLEAERKSLNAALAAAGRTEKISFTHIIAWAIVQATKQHRVMGHTLAMRDGQPHRVRPDGIGLGLAVDVTRKDGSRGLVVPVIKHAEAMDFGTFHAAYEALVEKARTSKLMPDDFAGATMSLTNPGGLGTIASVPRLMAGQGSIIAVGAIGYPPEFATAPPERIRDLGLSKVMTVTSTYDHRVIQGAESGQFLGTLEGMLGGADGFYEGIGAGLGVARVASRDPEVQAPPAPAAIATPATPNLTAVAAAMALIKAFRTHGHLAARLDPLGSEPVGDPALDPGPLGLTPDVMATIPASVLRVHVPGDTLRDALPHLQAAYCGTIAYEIEHIASHEERMWLREKIESGTFRQPMGREERVALLERLTAVDAFERFLHKSYLGQKRFSIEGVDALVPMLDLAIQLAAGAGAREVVLGMAHRGRLNVLAHTVRRPYETIFAEFEGGKKALGTDDEGETGTGDVKYHHGAEGTYEAGGREVRVTLSPNPSHLEFVGPVVDGRARARQSLREGAKLELDHAAAVPVVIHGDAAFAAQGVVAETLNLGALPGYEVGGTLHLIANNQIGFTTDVRDARSTRHASDLAKGFDIPIVHVNADDPEACLAAIRLCMAYREKFGGDSLIDLVGYRRHGHNEGDEPAYTQPLMYSRIRALPPARERYATTLVAEGVVTEDEARAGAERAYARLGEVQQALKGAAKPGEASPGQTSRKVLPSPTLDTAVPAERLVALNDQMLAWPDGFKAHPKLARQLERRRAAMGPEGGIDWGHAESLAFASLLTEGVPLRLTGQDTERGTFSHRHLVLHDVETGRAFAPILHLPDARAAFELYNSPLSELAAIGFEYGYSVASPEVLVMWEAQFGDFVNGAQVMIDQFLAAGLSKWGQTTRLTLLLPHGYEGQGPEHSSARLERFLQLAAENNMRVANCTTPAQYFHLLRRQALRDRLRPLIVMTPKSLLRLPAAASRLDELSSGTFQPVMDDAWARDSGGEITRVVLCSGKVYYDLLAEAEKMTAGRPAIVRVEQLYTFPEADLREVLGRYLKATEVVWTQEEPRNMGAWSYVEPRIRAILPAGSSLAYVGRPERASPAEGYPAAHAAEQSRIIASALEKRPARREPVTMPVAGEAKD